MLTARFAGQILVGSTNELLLLRSRRMDEVGAIAVYHLGGVFVVVVVVIVSGGSCCRRG